MSILWTKIKAYLSSYFFNHKKIQRSIIYYFIDRVSDQASKASAIGAAYTSFSLVGCDTQDAKK